MKLHVQIGTIEGLSQDAYSCSLCRCRETTLDSAPGIPEEEESGNGSCFPLRGSFVVADQ